MVKALPAIRPNGVTLFTEWCTVLGVTPEIGRTMLTPDRIIDWNHQTYVIPLPDEEPAHGV